MGSLGNVDFSSPFFENFPALQPPPGVQSNFDNPLTRGPDVVIASSICLALMLSLVVIRFYTKIAIKRRFGWDDCECTLSAPSKALLILVGLCIPAVVRLVLVLPMYDSSKHK